MKAIALHSLREVGH